MNFYRVSLLLLIIFLFIGCGKTNQQVLPSFMASGTLTHPPISPTIIPPSATTFLQVTNSVTVTPTENWVFHTGNITCPILLYHRISNPPMSNSAGDRYYTSPSNFEWQMQALKDWGYTTVPISVLVEELTKGTNIPPRPVVITFDDGDVSVFDNAFPIMQAKGFSGVIYLVGNYIGSQGYMDESQIHELIERGWEIGSHSMTHAHLPTVHDQLYKEGGESKIRLESEFGVRVESFAYPYGEIDSFVVNRISEYGYLAAVGLGTQSDHGLETLFYMSRIEVRNGINRSAFGSLLPWVELP